MPLSGVLVGAGALWRLCPVDPRLSHDGTTLTRSYRAGDLTPVWVPDAAHEALRDVVRAREAAKKDQLRARHRLGKFLLRHGRRRPPA